MSRLFLSILCFSLLFVRLTEAKGQRVLIFAVEGGRSYSRVELNDVYLGTIDDGEHLYGSLHTGTNQVRIEKRGYEAIEYAFENPGQDVVVEIKTTHRNVLVSSKALISSQYYSLFPDPEISQPSGSNGGQSTSGSLPGTPASIMIHYQNNKQDQPCANAGFVENQISGCFMETYQLVDRRFVESIIEEQRLSMSGLVSQQTLIDAGEITGASYALSATVDCLGPEKVNVQMNLINCETSEISWVASFRNLNVNEVFSKLSEAINH